MSEAAATSAPAAAAAAAAVPEAAIHWMVRYCASNAELAVLSNVSRSWRNLVQQVLWEVAMIAHGCGSSAAAALNEADAGRTTADGLLVDDEGSHNDDKDQEGSCRGTIVVKKNNRALPVSRLLLPCMMRATMLLCDKRDGAVETAGNLEIESGETYCLAWFAPEGIRTIQLGDVPADDDDDATKASTTTGPGPSKKRTTDSSTIPATVLLCPEWRGYRDARQVLRPFGYADHFVSTVLRRQRRTRQRQQQQQQRELVDADSCKTCTSVGLLPRGFSTDAPLYEDYYNSRPHTPIAAAAMAETLVSDAEEEDARVGLYNYHRPTFAVRGVTVARPDGYCCCMDLPVAVGDEDKRNEQEQLLRNVVPRVISQPPQGPPTAPPWGAAAIQFLNASMSHAVCMVTPPFMRLQYEPLTIFIVGIATEDGCFVSGLRHRSVEVGHLYPPHAENSDEEEEPWSAVCAAASAASAMGTSWASADRGTVANNDTPANGGGASLGRRSTSPLPYGFSSSCDDLYVDDGRMPRGVDNDRSSDSGDSSRDGNERDMNGGSNILARYSVDGHGRLCRCPFATVPGKFDDRSSGDTDDDEDDDHEQGSGESPMYRQHSSKGGEAPLRIHRGVTGPGQWRCYTAVFDGVDGTRVRIDGIPEPMTVQLPSARESSSPRGKEPKDPETGFLSLPHPSPQSALDGITIGSDHCFGMSLCCGYGSGGEGQGAISELVVMKGRFDDADVSMMEAYLMAKHGIPAPRPNSASDRHQDEKWTRRSHALYSQSCTSSSPSPSPLAGAASAVVPEVDEAPEGVPLRIMTRHPIVAWHRIDPVSGQQVRAAKIGSRPGGACSSSESW